MKGPPLLTPPKMTHNADTNYHEHTFSEGGLSLAVCAKPKTKKKKKTPSTTHNNPGKQCTAVTL
jgi:hypothetical protein